jgi:hypothetical protein
MDTALDLSRWQEKPLGLAYRRWTIVSTGMRQILRMRFFKILLFIAWTAGVLMAAIGFLFVQSVASGGWLESWAGAFGPRSQAIVSAFCAFVLLYPEIIIRGLFTLIFWLHSYVGLYLGIIALTVVVPRLVTRDRANNALTIYLSRPLTSTDYLLGKLGTIVGLLLLVWTGPLLFGWLLSMLFAPDREFIVHSFAPLLSALTFNLAGLVVLSAIALGVSSTGKSARNTILLWIGMWIIVGSIANIETMPDWIRDLSFTHDLQVLRQALFPLDQVLTDAAKELPLTNPEMTRFLGERGKVAAAEGTTGAVVGLAVLVVASSFVFFRKLRPE